MTVGIKCFTATLGKMFCVFLYTRFILYFRSVFMASDPDEFGGKILIIQDKNKCSQEAGG